MKKPLLQVENLSKDFQIGSKFLGNKTYGIVRAVDAISFSVYEGETLALVGESGCGKSTTARMILRLIKPTSGHVWFGGTDLATLGSANMRQMRRHIQIIFQDPYASLNPRMSVGETLEEPLITHHLGNSEKRWARVEQLVQLVGLSTHHLRRFPHELSGGQRQRVGIARALAVEPQLIICDEPVSSLDVSIQAQIINLLKDLQTRMGLVYLFIAHDLAVVNHMADRVAVMYLGRIVELAMRDELFLNTRHPYTQALLDAVPRADPHQTRSGIMTQGELPSPLNPPAGCHFHPRCPFSVDRCRSEIPSLLEYSPNHWVACHRVSELEARSTLQQIYNLPLATRQRMEIYSSRSLRTSAEGALARKG